MRKEVRISASVLSSDFSRLGEEVDKVIEAGADMIHMDVMDGHFVPNLTIGPAVIKSVRSRAGLPFDTHLMLDNPQDYVEIFREAGADIITVQAEACYHLQRVLCSIREAGAKSGVAVNPATPVDFLHYVMDVVDLVLVMTVNPGFGGQEFIESTIPKIREVRKMIDETGRDIFLEVDGGINPTTAKIAIEAGADLLVSGSCIFGSSDYKQTINKLKEPGR
ncbi:MAG: ribulose-phosphate 3-epimerase [Vulcanimicrobiota bacterium]